jgi:hypothetical protein
MFPGQEGSQNLVLGVAGGQGGIQATPGPPIEAFVTGQQPRVSYLWLQCSSIDPRAPHASQPTSA